ncbi:MAG TPA: nitroreductase family protein [Spirochaetia bacterium]|nr:nitroreductase family protein [Spirochaetia bacterium]
MDFLQLVRERESVRSYDPTRPVERAVLQRILEAAHYAPSAANRQPWRFMVICSREVLAKVRRCYDKPWFQDAPTVLAMVGKVGEAWTRQDGWNSIETDLTIAMDHLILAAESEGVASCWVAAFDPILLRSSLSLAADERVYALTPLGYPRPGYASKTPKQRKTLEEIVRYV